jgi:ABC-type multidrug transport system ATPase subunit
VAIFEKKWKSMTLESEIKRKRRNSNLKKIIIVLSIIVGIFVLLTIVNLATNSSSDPRDESDIDENRKHESDDLKWLDTTTTIVSACVTCFMFLPVLSFAIAAFVRFRSFERACEAEFRRSRKRIKKEFSFLNQQDVGSEKRIVKKKTKKIRENVEFSLLNQQEDDESKSSNNDDEIDDFVISFLNLSFWVPVESWIERTQRKAQNLISCQKDIKETTGYHQLLHNVSGVFQRGMTHVIFGPYESLFFFLSLPTILNNNNNNNRSGSGKTTLLNLISGRTRHGMYSGVRMINGVPQTDQTYRTELKTVGYVTQRDEFLSSLTVLETLVFGAMLRVKSDDISFRLDRVREVLKQVDLWRSRYKQVGGATIGSGGISGGQRRRLSIALELLTDSKLLLLDEPTSGLDAAASLNVVRLLRTLSRSGNKAVVTTIHQPRQEIFKLFDSLFLLGKGGYLTFQGTAERAATFLASSNSVSKKIVPSSYSNPGDYIIDILGLDSKKTDDEDEDDDDKNDHEECEFGEALSREYHESSFHKDALMTIEKLVIKSSSTKTPQERITTTSVIKDFWSRSWILYGRRLKLVLAAPKEAIAIYAQCLIVTMIIAMAFSYVAYFFIIHLHSLKLTHSLTHPDTIPRIISLTLRIKMFQSSCSSQVFCVS